MLCPEKIFCAVRVKLHMHDVCDTPVTEMNREFCRVLERVFSPLHHWKHVQSLLLVLRFHWVGSSDLSVEGADGCGAFPSLPLSPAVVSNPRKVDFQSWGAHRG